MKERWVCFTIKNMLIKLQTFIGANLFMCCFPPTPFYDLLLVQAFVQFITGCSSLPPGGLANLHPHLTVVRKDLQTPFVYPSVNTCVHYLKLPEYPSAEILRERLLEAMKEKGFHLN